MEQQTMPVLINNKEVDVETIIIEGVDYADYPDLVDAFVSSAQFTDGVMLTDGEIDTLQEENPELIQTTAQESFH